MIADLQRWTAGVVFDEQPMPELGVEDLALDSAQRLFGDNRLLIDEALLSLRLLVREQGRLVPTKGAVLLFGKQRNLHFPDAWVQCGRFLGTDNVYIFDHIEIHASLPECVDKVMDFLKKHAMRGADLTEVRRKDVWSIPLLMLREAVINALVHADYSHRGAPIRIAFFDDRIEIENPGILVPGMTIDDMKRGVSNLRNRVIARVFKELKLIEQWGSGVKRIFAEAQTLGLPASEIEEIGMHLRLTIFLADPITLHATPIKSGKIVSEPVEAGLESQGRLESRLESELAARVVSILNEHAMGKADLARLLGHKGVSGALHRQIRRLLDQRVIEMTLPHKPSSRLQKYRLTRAGQALLAQLNEE